MRRCCLLRYYYNAFYSVNFPFVPTSHYIRKLKALKEDRSSPHAYCFARNMLAEIGAIFTRWHAFQKSPGSREDLSLDTQQMRNWMNDFCVIFRYSSDQRVQTRTKRLIDNWQHLFTFLEHDGVQLTNNTAERAIRPAVQWRKICFGSQSQIGEHFTERLLTVVRTCQLHGTNPFLVLTKLVNASFSPKAAAPLRSNIFTELVRRPPLLGLGQTVLVPLFPVNGYESDNYN